MGSFKPGNFFLALFDFLGIFVPGAVLLFILLDVGWIRALIDDEFAFIGSADSTSPSSKQVQLGAAFFFGAYFLGHIVYQMGSLFLDPRHERWLTKESRDAAIAQCSPAATSAQQRQHHLSSYRDQLFLRRDRTNITLNRKSVREYIDLKIKQSDFKPFYNVPLGDAVWRLANCITVSENEYAAGYLERTRAESRFFRTMTIVFIIAMIVFLAKAEWFYCSTDASNYQEKVFKTHVHALLVCIVFFCLSWFRFRERRLKHEAETYNYFIAVVTGPWKQQTPDGQVVGKTQKSNPDDKESASQHERTPSNSDSVGGGLGSCAWL